jgi:hypothetical protein
MARYTPPKSVSKNRKDEDEEEQKEAPEEEQEDTRSHGRPKMFKGTPAQSEQPEIETELLKYLIKNGFLNEIQVTMSFEQLLNTIEKMSG